MNINNLYKQILEEYGLNKKNDIPHIIKYKRKYIIEKWIKETKDKNIVLWGAGEHTKELLDGCKIDKTNIVAIIDKNPELWGKELNGIKIISKNVHS